MSGPVVLGLLVAAVVAGLDLVSAVQGLFSRPIVVGLASGLIIGCVTAFQTAATAKPLMLIESRWPPTLPRYEMAPRRRRAALSRCCHSVA